ncbi:biliverdin-producing heme oxygenase [Pseudomonas sp. SDI]|uniref:biliverdin-producing heme oxygenase n=1 Tax=Pseudomonas sp. SDI TaxID=2170734 RepID=UPI000DE5E099|nr:biliverdin-producing heme oxygenase [Pseudomonas sp. SDI]PWB35320.1 biliverdin-producing heme oxygenase [Pseudomonas sp. SDI]
MPPEAGNAVPAILAALRLGTADLHRRLEARLPFFSAQLDRDYYRRLLMAYYGFHAPLEQALAAHVGALDPARRAKTPTLIRDLQALGLAPAQIAALPRCEVIPLIRCEDSALGAMYVIEGATLGGQVLKRAMAERLHIDAGNGGAFLDVYGQATGPLWRSFLGFLASAVTRPQQHEVVVAAAIDTFSSFERWLDAQEVLL